MAAINDRAASRRLRREVGLAALVYVLGLLAGGWLIVAAFGWSRAAGWLALALLTSAYVLLDLGMNLPLNHRRSDPAPLPTLGAGTALTLLRGLLLAILAGFLLLPRPVGALAWFPGLCYGVAAVADYLDGFVARVTNHATPLGEKLDMDLDALGILIAPLVGVVYGQLPVWYLLVSLARYLFVFGLWLRRRANQPVYPLTESRWRRPFAGFQMGLILAVLLPPLSPPSTHVAATVFMIPFFVGFTRDWLVVSGGISPDSRQYLALSRASEHLFYDWFPMLWRVMAVSLAASVLIERGTTSALWLWVAILALLILVGLVGRLAATVALSLAGLALGGSSLSAAEIALLAVLSLILLLGTGRYSLWKPDEAFLGYHAGGES